MSVQAFTVLTGSAAPLMRANVDTDIIIRIERITQLARSELGRYAMEAIRFLPEGGEDPSFILNQLAFRDAPIVLTGPNFGCGSSREHAVWALHGMGLRCVIAPSFGDIFYANCFQNGMLPIRLPMEVIEGLAVQCAEGAQLTVDLPSLTITAPDGRAIPFTIDARRREMLMLGLDDIGLTLKDDEKILRWQAADRLIRPWAWPAPSPATT